MTLLKKEMTDITDKLAGSESPFLSGDKNIISLITA
ncbi:hypothetical protein QFZ81_003109 [Paenibacillus sp. V4I9]|nr:hypothetical protein [Paenibacillus sp. V4I9]